MKPDLRPGPAKGPRSVQNSVGGQGASHRSSSVQPYESGSWRNCPPVTGNHSPPMYQCELTPMQAGSAAQAARRLASGEAGEFTTFPAWTDGALLSGYSGIPTIVLGPGESPDGDATDFRFTLRRAD